MPRWASRITPWRSQACVERLPDIISAGDCISEASASMCAMAACLPDGSHFHASDPRASYWSLWDAINGAGSVERNRWCG